MAMADGCGVEAGDFFLGGIYFLGIFWNLQFFCFFWIHFFFNPFFRCKNIGYLEAPRKLVGG